MKWRVTTEEHANIDAAHQAHYEPEADGIYVAVVIDDDGSRIDPPPDVSGLKSALAKQKEEARRLREELQAVRADKSSSESHAELALLQRRYEESESRVAQIAIDGQKALDDLAAKYAPLVAEGEAKLAVFTAGLDENAIEREIHRAITEAHGVPKLLSHQLRKRVRVELDSEGARKVVVVDDDGNTWLDEHGQPVPVDRLVEEIKLFGDPAFRHAFDSDRNGNGK